VDAALARHLAVIECGAFGVADAKWGEAVHAVVVRSATATVTDEELIALWNEHRKRIRTRTRASASGAPRDAMS
jgi:long-chain acyl-CoA synthetase